MNTQFKVYVIRNKVTGLYLSDGSIYARTWAKFTEKPRLFKVKSAATNAMKCWSMGGWNRHWEQDNEYIYPEPPDKVPDDRKLEDLHVVSGTLTLDI